MKRLALLLSCGLLACAGQKSDTTPPEPQKPPPEVSPAPPPPSKPAENVSLRDVGLDPDKLDRGADPCDDFFRFACGGWMDKNEIPADLPAWGSINELKRHNDDVLHEALEAAAKAPGEDPATQKLGAYQRACMNEAAIEKVGTRPLAGLQKVIGKVRDVPSLAAAVTELHKNRIFVLFDLAPMQDYKDSSQVIANVGQNGLGLPDRDYYLRTGENDKQVLAAYQAHVERMLRLMGQTAAGAKKGAAEVISVETELARAQKSKVELRDVAGTYNRLDRGGLVRTAPAVVWDNYFKAMGTPDITAVNVEAPAYLERVDVLMTTIKPALWKSYLTYQLGAEMAPYLTRRFVDEAFARDKLVRGAKEPAERWRRCLDFVDRDIGELAAQPFVQKTIGAEGRDAAETMIKAVSAALGRSLTGVTWMDAATQEKAVGKLEQIDFQVGYPKVWKTYDFTINDKDFAGSHLAAQRFEQARRLAKIGKPVDRGEFHRVPQAVNAYYDSSLNQMVILAGIMQAPFYNPKASVAVNLGGMGMVVGHELTHGFDDQGAQFDGKGNLSAWWPDEVNARFRERTQCVSKVYSGFEILPGVNVNGDLTLGENIADIGGVKMAFRAYRALRKEAKTAQVADGFSEDQQFFLAHGQAWCGKDSEAYARMNATTNPHSPKKFRVNGTLSQLRDFANAFQCKEGAKMRPEKICEVW